MFKWFQPLIVTWQSLKLNNTDSTVLHRSLRYPVFSPTSRFAHKSFLDPQVVSPTSRFAHKSLGRGPQSFRPNVKNHVFWFLKHKWCCLRMQGRSEWGCVGGAIPRPPPNWDDEKKSGKIMKQSGKKSGKKYAKMREIRDIYCDLENQN